MEGAGPGAAGPRGPFVGRETELGWLEESLADAVQGRPRLALLAGDAGIGKSRLVREFGSLARRSGIVVSTGRCYESLQLPYLPFVDALRARIEVGDVDLGPADATLPALLRLDRAEGHGGAATAPGTAEPDRLRFLLGTSRSVIRLARAQPTLLVLEDVHWADPASLDLLEHLVGVTSEAALDEPLPLLLLATHRPVEARGRLARTLARLAREPLCTRLDLGGIDQDDARRLIESHGLGRASTDLVRTLWTETRGNPLFLEEALRHLVEKGDLSSEGGYALLAPAAPSLRLPPDVTDVLAERIQQLDDGMRLILLLSAFLGDSFAASDLAAVAGMDRGKLEPILDGLIEEGLLVADGDRHRFHHSLVRHVLASEPPPGQRRRIHRIVADALAKSPDAESRVAEIAQHLVAAGAEADVTDVVDYARRAGDEAIHLFAWGEAAHLLTAAVSRSEAEGRLSAKERGDLHCQAGVLYQYDWDPGPARHHYDRAAVAYRDAGDKVGLARVLNQQIRAALTLGATSYGAQPDLRALESALADLGDGEKGLRSYIHYTLAEAHWAARQPERAEEAARRALELGERVDDPRSQRDAWLALGLAQYQGLQVSGALESWSRSLEQARRTGNPWLENAPRQRRVWGRIQRGELEEAAVESGEALALARTTHDAGETSMALANRATLDVARGDFRRAEEHAREAMAMVYRSRYPWSGALALLSVACARALCGEEAESTDALAFLSEPGRVFDDPGPVDGIIAPIHRGLLKDDADDASALEQLGGLLRALEPDASLLWLHCSLVEIAARHGKPPLARHSARVVGLAAEAGLQITTGWLYLVPRVLGLAAGLDRRWDEAARYFEEALDVGARSGARPELARTCLDYARLLASRGGVSDRSRVEELGQQARILCGELGMAPYLDAACSLAGSQPPTQADPGYEAPGGLTWWEAEIVPRLARGRSVEEIGEELLLRPATVARHMERIFEKLGAAGRTDVAGFAFGQGLLHWKGRPSGATRIILVTDMKNFTPLVERLGDVRAQGVIRSHNRILRACLRTHRGSEIAHTGDGIMASFREAKDATRCARAMQEALRAFSQEHRETPLNVRIGLHAGRPLVEEDRLFGSAINVAARICAEARPGAILVSESVRALAEDEGPFASRGLVTLKGISQPLVLHELEGGGRGM